MRSVYAVLVLLHAAEAFILGGIGGGVMLQNGIGNCCPCCPCPMPVPIPVPMPMPMPIPAPQPPIVRHVQAPAAPANNPIRLPIPTARIMQCCPCPMPILMRPVQCCCSLASPVEIISQTSTATPVGVPDVIRGACGEIIVPLFNPPQTPANTGK